MFNTCLLWVCQFPVISTAHQWNSSHAESQASSHPRQYHKLQNSVLHPSKRRKCWFSLHKNLTFGRHLISARECCTSKTGTENTRWAKVWEVCFLSPPEKQRFVKWRVILTCAGWHFTSPGILPWWHLQKSEKRTSKLPKISNKGTWDRTQDPSLMLHGV